MRSRKREPFFGDRIFLFFFVQPEQFVVQVAAEQDVIHAGADRQLIEVQLARRYRLNILPIPPSFRGARACWELA